MTLKKILSECLTYSSGDNTQPFRFKIKSENEFEIYHDAGVAAHRLNYNNIASVIAYGTLLETISLISKKNKLQAEFKNLNENFNQSTFSLWGVIFLKPSDVAISDREIELMQALSKRAVDRRLYSQVPITALDVEWIQSETKNSFFVFKNKLSENLKKIILDLEEEVWKDSQVAQDIFRWIKFTPALDGLGSESLGLKFFHKPLIKLFRKFPWVYKLSVAIGGSKMNRQILKEQLNASGGFGFFSLSKESTMEDLVDLGRVYFRVWIYLSGKGYGFQPITFSTMSLYQEQTKNLPPDWSNELLIKYPKLLQIYLEEKITDQKNIPVWAFRVGAVEKVLPLKAHSSRFKIEDVLITDNVSSSTSDFV